MAQLAKTDPTYVDLHGYREEEVESVLESVSEMLREQFSRGSTLTRQEAIRSRASG